LGKESRDHDSATGAPRIKQSAIALLLIIAWLIGAAAGLRSEAGWLTEAGKISSLSAAERRLHFVGPVYRLIEKVSEITPPESTIYFFNPSRFDAAEYFHLKARYYLYPRRIKNGRNFVSVPEIKKNDYLILYITPETGASVLTRIEALDFLERLADYSDYESYWVVYRVAKGVVE